MRKKVEGAEKRASFIGKLELKALHQIAAEGQATLSVLHAWLKTKTQSENVLSPAKKIFAGGCLRQNTQVCEKMKKEKTYNKNYLGI